MRILGRSFTWGFVIAVVVAGCGRKAAPPSGTGARKTVQSYYEALLRRLAPDGLDVVVLGLGDDGHTASLVPGDPVVDERHALVATTGAYRGHQRITLTRPSLDRAGAVVWLVTGADKAGPLRQLMAGDHTIPAGLVSAPNQMIFADRAAAADLDH